MAPKTKLELTFAPLTREKFADLEELFGPKGACGGCWCMWWRLPRKQFDLQKGEGNRKELLKVVAESKPVGVIAYISGKPAGWCAVAPREELAGLSRSRILAPVDEEKPWSITCLFIKKEFRRMQASVALIKAAVDYAQSMGAKIIEAYPQEPRQSPMPDVFAFTGIASAFRKAGFKEIARRSPTRPIMRITRRDVSSRVDQRKIS
jgi:ribosomal protein S18 acetylase RimI-like enzyme